MDSTALKETVLEKDSRILPEIMDRVVQYALDYLRKIDDFPVGRNAPVIPHDSLSDDSMGLKQAFGRFIDQYEQLMVASSGPRYFGFVTGGVTPAALMGDWLTSVFDQNPQGFQDHGDISANIERNTITLLLELLRLPESFTGGFVTGATMANFSSLAVARQWVGEQMGKDIAREGMDQKLHILSATPHSSSVKSLAMLGIGSNNLIKIKVLENREAMDINDLEQRLTALKGQPAIVISSAGTVNTVDFDDMQAISTLREKYNFWWHIDAAFGGFVACSSNFSHLLKGWEHADSITVDCHKWLNTPYDGAVFLVKKDHATLQVQTFQNSNAPYLGDPLAKCSYLNFLPENSRRLRALPAWFTLMAYGREGYREIVDNNIKHAQEFARLIRQSSRFRLLADVRVNVVAFTLNEQQVEAEKVNNILKKLNERGKVFITPTIMNGNAGFRAAFVNWRTKMADVELLMNELDVVS
ncbi:Aromatic-L-amino-acid decarboxylase [Fulvivirga imtechensis AK7]|uniref:Aromatic-L-amino-acid decarboxylase n=1 Tax=Fulvivirga imtechensis AK7 TaxID=1237149 RepID=L8JXJ1_9BACT|nr:pyridoxal-dependent decarboxylase [Fulvivirga imtechensis]ELR73510.1 Aromatic-L-amino-acid decarboxylase [Fulvivirga imtechensis AK7]